MAPAGSSLLMSLVLRQNRPGRGDSAGEQSHADLPQATASEQSHADLPQTTASEQSHAGLPQTTASEQSHALLPLTAAVAVCDVVHGEARIKWPNDIVFEDPSRTAADGAPALTKLAGILVEGRPQAGWAVLGIGLNVAVRLDDLPSELRAGAATLGLDGSDIGPLLTRLLDALSRRLDERPAAILQAWSVRDALQGRSVQWAEGEGRAEGVDDEGRLQVALAKGGRVALDAGEVHLAGAG